MSLIGGEGWWSKVGKKGEKSRRGNRFASVRRLNGSDNLTKGEYYFKRAFSYDKLSDARAWDDYQKSIELNYKVATVYNNLAIDASILDEDSLALVFLDKALKADPSRLNELRPFIKMCQEHVEFQKTDAWKEYKAWKNRTKQGATRIELR